MHQVRIETMHPVQLEQHLIFQISLPRTCCKNCVCNFHVTCRYTNTATTTSRISSLYSKNLNTLCSNNVSSVFFNNIHSLCANNMYKTCSKDMSSLYTNNISSLYSNNCFFHLQLAFLFRSPFPILSIPHVLTNAKPKTKRTEQTQPLVHNSTFALIQM